MKNGINESSIVIFKSARFSENQTKMLKDMEAQWPTKIQECSATFISSAIFLQSKPNKSKANLKKFEWTHS
jgi:hypothetical protein